MNIYIVHLAISYARIYYSYNDKSIIHPNMRSFAAFCYWIFATMHLTAQPETFFEYVRDYVNSESNVTEADNEDGESARLIRLYKTWSERLYPSGNIVSAAQGINSYVEAFNDGLIPGLPEQHWEYIVSCQHKED